MPFFLLALLGVGVFLLAKSSGAAPAPPPGLYTGFAYNPAQAIPVPLTAPGGTITVPYGSSLVAQGAPGFWSSVTTNNATIVAPSIPLTTNGFVAVGRGAATITGVYMDDSKWQPGGPPPPVVTISANIIVQ